MTEFTPKHIAWFIPVAYLFHLADEYFAGFPNWFSGIFKVNLSLDDFIFINSIGFTTTIMIAFLYTFDKVNSFIVVSLGTLFFINGVIHIVSSLFTLSYSPGTISGILIYLPLGYLIFKKFFSLLPEQQRGLSIMGGILVQIVVSLIALNI